MFYGTAAEFTTYHEARGRTVPDSWTDSYIEAALLVASEWVDHRYGDTFTGYPSAGYSQTRQWPRKAAVTDTYIETLINDDVIPKEVKEATYEVAFREVTEPGVLDVDFTQQKYNSVQIDDALKVEYNTSLDYADVQKQIGIVYSILKPVLDPSKEGSFARTSGRVSRV